MEENKVYSCKCNEVIVLERQRKAMDKEKLNELKGSIERHGQIQPGVCHLDADGQPVLIVGERRLKACEELGCEFKYVLKEDLTDPADVYEIELIENIHREDLSWQDRSEALLRLHELRQEQRGPTKPGTRGGHGIRDTAAETHLSVGTVQEEIELALFAREIPEVASATNRTMAKNIVRRLKEEVTREEALDEAIKKAREQEKETVTEAGGTIAEDGVEPAEGEVEFTPAEARLLEFDRRSILGTCEAVGETLQKESFDLVCFDPPWSVNYDSVYLKDGTKKLFKDSIDIIDEKLPEWLKLIYELMKKDSHLYMFFGIVHHGKIYEMLESVGFTVNRMPIFWHKRGAHRTRNPSIWPGRCYEAIAYARKGSKDLAEMGRPDIVTTSQPTPKMKLSHPSAKHPDIYRDLLQRSCKPGERVLDPMSGSGMFGVACESLRTALALDWFMVEQDEDFRTLGLHNLMLGYSTIAGDESEPVPEYKPDWKPQPLPEDFKELVPGTPEWSRFFKENPDRQEEMLEWRTKQPL